MVVPLCLRPSCLHRTHVPAVQALEEPLPLGQFPAQSVKSGSRTWLLDAGAASTLRAVRALDAYLAS